MKILKVMFMTLLFFIFLDFKLMATTDKYKIAVFSYSFYDGIPEEIIKVHCNHNKIITEVRWLERDGNKANIVIQSIMKKKLIEEIKKLGLHDVVSFEEVENMGLEEIGPRPFLPPKKDIFGFVTSSSTLKDRCYDYLKFREKLGVDYVVILIINPSVSLERSNRIGIPVTAVLLDLNKNKFIRSAQTGTGPRTVPLGVSKYEDYLKDDFEDIKQLALNKSDIIAQNIIKKLKITNLLMPKKVGNIKISESQIKATEGKKTFRNRRKK